MMMLFSFLHHCLFQSSRVGERADEGVTGLRGDEAGNDGDISGGDDLSRRHLIGERGEESDDFLR